MNSFQSHFWTVLFKGFLTLGIVYHCSVVLMVPNRSSYLGQYFEPGMKSYIQFLELGTSWSFFAPDPGPPPLFLEWETFDQKGSTLEVDRWPPLSSHSFMKHEGQNRLMAAARFMVASDEMANQMMTSYLCREQEGHHASQTIVSVKLWSVSVNLPRFEGVMHHSWTQNDARSTIRHLVSHRFCQELKSLELKS